MSWFHSNSPQCNSAQNLLLSQQKVKMFLHLLYLSWRFFFIFCNFLCQFSVFFLLSIWDDKGQSSEVVGFFFFWYLKNCIKICGRKPTLWYLNASMKFLNQINLLLCLFFYLLFYLFFAFYQILLYFYSATVICVPSFFSTLRAGWHSVGLTCTENTAGPGDPLWGWGVTRS